MTTALVLQETAALREPYLDTENKGILMETDASLLEKVSSANASGFRLEIHAIGGSSAAAATFNEAEEEC